MSEPSTEELIQQWNTTAGDDVVPYIIVGNSLVNRLASLFRQVEEMRKATGGGRALPTCGCDLCKVRRILAGDPPPNKLRRAVLENSDAPIRVDMALSDDEYAKGYAHGYSNGRHDLAAPQSPSPGEKP